MSEQVNDPVVQSLYAKREKIYPREVHGFFAQMRLIAMVGLLGIYYGVPWLQWDDRQAVLWDLPERKFYIFGWVFWPQDFIYLAALLIVAALALFMFTALAGRLWCGYACPQTVWTEIFMWFEQKIEGDRRAQMRLDKGPWTAEKFRKKATKHTVWVVFSLYTGFTFVGYFVPIRELGTDMLALNLGGWAWFWIFFYAFATWGNAGFMREQVCLYMCPYARFQSAMFDDDTLIISYDERRGEPRGSRKRNIDPKDKGLGDCIDCTMCVQVCPTGIDIRNGLQYECIACAACIDVCDDVMEKMGYAPGLIKYTTGHAVDGESTHIARPRLFVYVGLIVTVLAVLGWSITTRVPVMLDVIRDRNALYRETNQGLIENVYTLRLVNMDQAAHTYRLSVSGLTDALVDTDLKEIRAGAGQVTEFAARVSADPEDIPRLSNKINFMLESENAEIRVEKEARFLGPGALR